MKRYNDLTVTPPDEIVKVIDQKRRTAYAIPTIYPFKVGEMVKGKKWSSPVTPFKPYWDGGWMIVCEGIKIPKLDKIVGWKTIEK